MALVADDDDESEVAFAEYDTLRVYFWPPTSAPDSLAGADGRLDRRAVDALLAFSSAVVGDYWASWNSSTVLEITFGVVDPTSAPTPGVFTVSCRAGGRIISAAAPSDECVSTSPPLEGRWGYALRPSPLHITSFVAFDPDDGDEVCGEGDTLTLVFNVPTDRGRLGASGPLYGVPSHGTDGGAPTGPAGGDRLVRYTGVGEAAAEAIPLVSGGALDQLLEFSPPLPPSANLSAIWRDASTLVLTILTPQQPQAALLPDVLAEGVIASGEAASGEGASGERTSGEVMSGDLTRGAAGSGEAAEAAAAAADAPSIQIGEFRASTRAGAALRDAAQTSVHTVTTSPPLTGSCGRPPQITAFVAADAADADAVCSDGDVLTLSFDRATDQPAARTRVEIDRLLAFSQALGHEYRGAWTDASTLAITIERGHVPAPELGIATASLRGPTVAGATLLRNTNQRSNPSASTSPPLEGSCGVPPQADALEPLVGPDAGGRPVTIFGSGLVSPRTGAGAVRCLWERWPPEEVEADTGADAGVANGQAERAVAAPAETEVASCSSAEDEPYAPDAPPPPPPPPFMQVATPQVPRRVSPDAVVCTSLPSLRAAHASVRVDRGDGVVLPSAEAASTAASVTTGPPPGLVYSFYAPAIISIIEPVGGPYRGGTSLTVHGSFFHGRLALERAGRRPLCRFGLAVGPSTTAAAATTSTAAVAIAATAAAAGTAAAIRGEAGESAVPGPMYVPAVWNGSSRATCLSPAWPRRWWPPEPSNGRLSSLELGFLPDGAEEAHWQLQSDGTPTGAPQWEHLDTQLSAVRPASGPRAAGTRVTLLGRGLGLYADELGGESPSLCRLGEAPPSAVHAIDPASDRVVCDLPACLGCPGGANDATTDTADAADAADAASASPSSASLASASPLPPCCRLHAALPVAVAINGRDWIGGVPPVRFRYYTPPVVSSLGAMPAGAPLSGPPLGGTLITVRGSGFQAVPNAALEARCRFGHVVVGAARVSDKGMLCEAPPHLSGIVAVAVAANGVDFVPLATAAAAGIASSDNSESANIDSGGGITTPLAGFTFEYLCSGYPDGPTCVADPNCGWCDDPSVGCLACTGLGEGGRGGCRSDDGGASFTCSSLAGAYSCGAPHQCGTLSWRHPVLLPGGPVEVSVTTELVNRSFAMYQLTPRHTNFVMRLELETPGWARAVTLFARKDLPPSGRPPVEYLGVERPAAGASQLRLTLEIGPSELGCLQRETQREHGRWPQLRAQSERATRWTQLERELVGALYSPTARWDGGSSAADQPEWLAESGGVAAGDLGDNGLWHGGIPAAARCDSWFVGAFGVQPPPPAPYQPSLVNASLSDDPTVPPPAPPATFTLNITLEPAYASFNCSDCAPPAPPRVEGFHRARDAARAAAPPAPLDRYGSRLLGDCTACGMRLRGAAEQVRDAGGQRLRLVHSLAPRARPQFGAVWYHRKLPVRHGFEVRFTVHFQRPSTCAVPLEAVTDGAAAAVRAAPGRAADAAYGADTEAAGSAQAELAPLWRRRWTGCGLGADGTPREGSVGGEGLALLIHDDPAGLEASGCVGAGVGYAYDGSYFSTCPRRIQPSLALQLSPHRNVTLVRRMGPHVASNEEPFLAWDDADSVGLHVNGTNVQALLQRSFSAPGRRGNLLDNEPHTVALISSGRDVTIFLDGEQDPSLSYPLNLSTLGAVDAAGNAWVGFTSATGGTSLDVDLLGFAFCSRPGCAAV